MYIVTMVFHLCGNSFISQLLNFSFFLLKYSCSACVIRLSVSNTLPVRKFYEDEEKIKKYLLSQPFPISCFIMQQFRNQMFNSVSFLQ